MRDPFPSIRGTQDMMEGLVGMMGARADTAVVGMGAGMGAAGIEWADSEAETLSGRSRDGYSGSAFIFLCHPAQSRPFASRKMQKPTKAGSRWKKST